MFLDFGVEGGVVGNGTVDGARVDEIEGFFTEGRSRWPRFQLLCLNRGRVGGGGYGREEEAAVEGEREDVVKEIEIILGRFVVRSPVCGQRTFWQWGRKFGGGGVIEAYHCRKRIVGQHLLPSPWFCAIPRTARTPENLCGLR